MEFQLNAVNILNGVSSCKKGGAFFFSATAIDGKFVA